MSYEHVGLRFVNYAQTIGRVNVSQSELSIVNNHRS